MSGTNLKECRTRKKQGGVPLPLTVAPSCGCGGLAGQILLGGMMSILQAIPGPQLEDLLVRLKRASRASCSGLVLANGI
jgi:hypothetical protein